MAFIMDKTILILNPSASRGTAIFQKDKIESALRENKIKSDLYITKSSEDLGRATENFVKEGYVNFIAAGGDGTVHYMIQKLANTDRNIGIIPIGSGNDMIKTFNIKPDIDESIKIIKNNNIKRIDLGLFNKKIYYIGVAGSGFDSEVARFANETRLPIKGEARYNFSVYKTLITFRPKIFEIMHDDISENLNTMMILVSNLKYYGGGMKVTPHADPFDAKLDVCIITAIPLIKFIKSFPSVYAGTHLDIPCVKYFKTEKVEVDCEKKFNVYGDGEYMGKLPAKFEVSPKSLNIFLPR